MKEELPAVILGSTFFAPSKPRKNGGKHGGSTGEAGGKLGEARDSWGKHAFCPLKILEKLGEAIGSSTLFIILKFGRGELGARVGRRRAGQEVLLEFYQRWAGLLTGGSAEK